MGFELGDIVGTIAELLNIGDGEGLLDIAAALDDDPETKALNLSGETIVTSIGRMLFPGTHVGEMAGDLAAGAGLVAAANGGALESLRTASAGPTKASAPSFGSASRKGGSARSGRSKLGQASSAKTTGTAFAHLDTSIFGPAAVATILQNVSALSRVPTEAQWAEAAAPGTFVSAVTLTNADPTDTISPMTGAGNTIGAWLQPTEFWCDGIGTNDAGAKVRLAITGWKDHTVVKYVQQGSPVHISWNTTMVAGLSVILTAQPTPLAGNDVNVSFTGMTKLPEWSDLKAMRD